jgi:hypothetical protein
VDPIGSGLVSGAHTVVLVEGDSDKSAIEALAQRHGRNLATEGISLVAMGGATNIRTYVRRFGNSRLAGLCDVGEEGDFRRALERAGLGSDLGRSDLEALGFFVCVADLEDELIRALGTATVERIVDAEGELSSFRTLQKQPAWRGAPLTTSCAGSWGRAVAARSATPAGSSRHSISIACRGRWICCWPTYRPV